MRTDNTKRIRAINVRGYGKDGFGKTWARTGNGFVRVQAETLGPEEILKGETHKAIARFVEWPELNAENAKAWFDWTSAIDRLVKESLQEAS